MLILYSCKDSVEGANSYNTSTSEKDVLVTSKEIAKLIQKISQLPLLQKDSVEEFYKKDPNPIWNDSEFQNSFIETLKQADLEGLNYKKYHGEEIDNLLSRLTSLTNNERSYFEILLTDSYFQYASHLLNGKVDPRKVHKIFDLPKNKASLSKLLRASANNNDIQVALKEIRPNHPVYVQLMALLKDYKGKIIEFEKLKKIEDGDLIKPGEQDERIQKITFRLMVLGFIENVDPFSFNYSENVQEAIKKLQSENGLLADGVIGKSTIALLNTDYQDRYNQILANLERWRWYPRDLGSHYILINIANFSLEVYEDSKKINTHKIIVGRPERKTPIFSEEIKYIIFNPTWTVPPTIKRNDVIPGVRKSISYLSKKKLNVYNSKGERLNPNSIDWSSPSVYSYTYRQNAGSTNPLGVVKIIYPNKHIVYLHDTPSKALFENNYRANSSGCIRVQEALGLAEYLLEDQPEYDSEMIQEILATGKTTEVKMKQQVKVHHLYWTAWMENGKPKFTNDLYKYDDKILAELLKTSKP